MKKKKLKIPSNEEWLGYQDDLDLIDLYNLFFGKSIEDVYYYYYFKSSAHISRSDELLYSNRKIFQYYIYAFVLYLQSDIGKSDDGAKDGFVRLLVNREEKEQGSVQQIFQKKESFQILDEKNNICKFSFSLKSIIETISNQYKNMEIDHEYYDEIPKYVEKLDKLID